MNAVRAMMRAVRIDTREIERKLGISLAQLFVLQQLAERPAESLNQLATRTATHQSSVSVVVRRLVGRGLVRSTASPNDKRRIEIALTPAGEDLLADAPQTITGKLMAALFEMPGDDCQLLAGLLEQWLTAVNINYSSPPMLGEDVG
jgi:DNA-binding MarR family transcriptional regulator